jgi:hypothetical protein
VAEHVGALSNFKAAQGLKGWPAHEAWASNGHLPAAQAMERELQPTDEGDPLVKSPLVQRGADAEHSFGADVDDEHGALSEMRTALAQRPVGTAATCCSA